MKNIKSFIIILFATLCFALPVSAAQNIKVFINNQEQSFSVNPIIQNDSTLVPMRELFNMLGFEITWKDEIKTVYAEKDNHLIEITINNDFAYIDGNEVKLAAPAMIHKDSTMVPLRFVAESTGYDVSWDGETSSVLISTGASESIPTPEAQTTQNLEDVSVMINTDSSQGSGTIISSDGYIVTNYHVLKNADKNSIIVVFNNQKYYYGNVSLIYLDKGRDIGVIKIDAENLSFAKVGDSSKVKDGDLVTVVGSPLGRLNVKTTGNILEQNADYFSASAPIEHGSSGGGMFNSKGELIGIAHSYDNLRHYYFIPINFMDTSKFASPESPLDIAILKGTTLQPPIGFSAYYENSGVYFTWAQNVDADFYCIYMSDEKDGKYLPIPNPNTHKNQWLWGFPYGFGITARSDQQQKVYYKIATSKDGVLSPLSEAIEVMQ